MLLRPCSSTLTRMNIYSHDGRIIYSVAPQGYQTPGFPSLYWPFPIGGDQSYYLYHTGDVWRFTLLWTLLFYAALHSVTAAYAVALQWRNWKVIWIVPVLWAVVGGIEALIAGSIVGGL